jgi:hypothetical protein
MYIHTKLGVYIILKGFFVFMTHPTGHASCSKALAETTARLEAAKKETADLKDTNLRMIAEHAADKVDLREALNDVEAKRYKLQSLRQYLNLSQ